MNKEHMEFRQKCAEQGVELTPSQAKKFCAAYKALKDEVKQAVKANPNFYLEICNRTTEQKLSDIKKLDGEGCPMSLKDYNKIQKMVKDICVIEGYD